jgi:hypothetical protein
MLEINENMFRSFEHFFILVLVLSFVLRISNFWPNLRKFKLNTVSPIFNIQFLGNIKTWQT